VQDIDRKNEQTAIILKRQADQIIELEALYKEEQILRKRYFNMMEDMKGKIRVYARWRPLSEKEHRENQRSVLSSPDEFTLEHPWKDDKPKQHQFDHVFDQFATQEQIFDDTKYLVQSAIDGYNVCIFAYGQTGSGKTFTIYGSDTDPGLTPRATRELFHCMKRDVKKFSFSLKVLHWFHPCSISLLVPSDCSDCLDMVMRTLCTGPQLSPQIKLLNGGNFPFVVMFLTCTAGIHVGNLSRHSDRLASSKEWWQTKKT
jgi:hypothetical protein